MKKKNNAFLLFLLIIKIQILFCQPGGGSPPDGEPGGSSTNNFDYSKITYLKKDEDLNGGEYSTSTSDQSILYVTSTTEKKVYNSARLTKSGDTAQSTI